MAVSGLYTLVQRPQYEASASVFVSTRSAESAADLQSGGSFSQQLVTSFASVAESPYVLEPVIQRLGMADSPPGLAGRIAVSVPPNSVVMQITVTDRTGVGAAETANAVARQLTRAVVDLTPNEAGSAASVKVTQIQAATPPQTPA